MARVCKAVGGMTIRHRELPQIPEGLPLMLNDKDAALLLGLSPSYLRKSRSDGQIGDRTPAPPFIKLGGRRLYRVADLKEWVASLESREAV
jgi:hypothetical protein